MYTNGNADMSYVETNTKSPLYKHVAKTYAWMFLGLLLTFLTCVALYATKLVIALLSHGGCRLRFWSQSWRSLSF